MSERAGLLQELGAWAFDVLVIGGGITGCGVAREAARRGLHVALVEKDDFASGTSSRSSRLIHGGVRYLEHGQIRLVFEASAERRHLLQAAPALVRPLAFTWPVYAGARIPRWKLGAGLWMYDVLAAFRNVGRHHRLSAREVLVREPRLRADGLRGGAAYYDAATNDARLTLANALDAARRGAVVVNHARVRELAMDGDRVVGAHVVDAFTGAEIRVQAKVVVNAAGPWGGLWAKGQGPRASEGVVRGSKGAHVSVPRERIGNSGAVTLLAPSDGRVFFVLPSGAQTIIGTTDSYTDASPDEVRASASDVEYLLTAANVYYPDAKLTRDDVIAAWAGIRPLVPTSAGSPSAASREHKVTRVARGLVSITGGKLTTYRVMAYDVVRAVAKELGVGLPPAKADDGLAVASDVAPDDIEGAAERAVLEERACTIGDVLIRRTRVAFETKDHGMSVAPAVAARMGRILRWDGAVDREIERYAEEVRRMFSVDEG